MFIFQKNGTRKQSLKTDDFKLGKVKQLNFTDGRRVDYVYDAVGTKLTMSYYMGLVTNYVNGFVYEEGELKFFGSPEGRVVKNGSDFEYQYAIADNQGNTRVVFTSEAAAPDETQADFESGSNEDFQNYGNPSSVSVMNHTPSGTYSQLLNGGYNSQVGATRSFKVYPGDKVKAEVYAKYWNLSGNGGDLADFAVALTSAFGLSSSATGEMLNAFNSANEFGAFVAGDDRPDDDSSPKGFITIMIFDKHHNFLDAAWDQLDEDYLQTGIETNHPFDHLQQEVTIKEEGFVYIFVSNENATQVDIHFDDLNITHTKSNVIQYNEYYPYGLQTSNSWTRENNSNNYLYNAGNELNQTSGWYEVFYRGYDPAIGRFLQIDPKAVLTHTMSSYQYGNDNPVLFNDPLGDQATVMDALIERNDRLEAMMGLSSNSGGGGGSGSRFKLSEGSGGPMIFNPWAGKNLGGDRYEGAWVPLDSYEGMAFYSNKYGEDSRIVIAYDNQNNNQAVEWPSLYREGNYDESYRGSRGFPHLTMAQGAYVVDGTYSVYKDSKGNYNVKFSGTIQHYAQALGESLFVAQTRLIVNGKPVSPFQMVDFGPGESMITQPGLIGLGFSNTVLPREGKVQIQLVINSYFKDGQHPGVDISRDSWYFTVPVHPTIGPK